MEGSMSASPLQPRKAGPRDLLFFTTPRLWQHWPLLPVVRYREGATEPELGVLYDLGGACGLYGYSCTVFLTNLFLLPEGLDAFLALPKEVYDTFEEVAQAGWVVD
jgi:hypothetical protein